MILPFGRTKNRSQSEESVQPESLSEILAAAVGSRVLQPQTHSIKHTEAHITDYDTDHLRAAINGAKLGLWDWNLITNKTTHNEWWGHLIGYSAEEVKNRPTLWEEHLHPQDRPLVFAKVEQLLKGDIDFYEAEFRLLTKNDDWRWILSRANVIQHDATGLPTRIAGTHQDINDRKNIEQQLIQDNTSYRIHAAS